MEEQDKIIPAHGGYKDLVSYQNSVIVYDLTAKFCERHVSSFRMKDQMIQAARSGKQNIVEGTMVSGTSKKSEMKLIGVSRGSLEELLEDYKDFLRQNDLEQWGKDDMRVNDVRKLAYESDRSYKTYESYTDSSENFANMLVCLIHQTNYLIDQQLRALEKQFLKEGGLTERLYKARRKNLGY